MSLRVRPLRAIPAHSLDALRLRAVIALCPSACFLVVKCLLRRGGCVACCLLHQETWCQRLSSFGLPGSKRSALVADGLQVLFIMSAAPAPPCSTFSICLHLHIFSAPFSRCAGSRRGVPLACTLHSTSARRGVSQFGASCELPRTSSWTLAALIRHEAPTIYDCHQGRLEKGRHPRCVPAAPCWFRA